MKYLIVFIFLIASFSSIAHPGRTDSNGGHNCGSSARANGLCTGYHFHNVNSSSGNNQSSNYNRSDWNHWIDSDGDCQNLRQELLISQSRAQVTYTNSRQCTVSTGLWIGAFTNNAFTRASDLDIDHVIPLAYAHRAGGFAWTRTQKQNFANDPINLLIVDDGLNQRKSDSGPSEFMPPSNQCSYAQIWDRVSRRYALQLEARDRIFLNNFLANC